MRFIHKKTGRPMSVEEGFLTWVEGQEKPKFNTVDQFKDRLKYYRPDPDYPESEELVKRLEGVTHEP